jgi:hypothetical protein
MDGSRATALVVSVLLVSSALALALPATANTAVIGEPTLGVESPTGPVQASQATTLTVTLTNDGELDQGDPENPQYEQQVTTARNVRVEVIESGIDAPVEVRTGTQTVGRLPTGETLPLEYDIEVGNATPGTYRVPVQIEYTYTRAIVFDEFRQPEFTTTTETVRTSVRLRVEARPQFRVTTEGTDGLFAGDTDRLALTVENVGTRTASDARLSLTAGAPELFFGPTANPERSTGLFVGDLAPSQSRQVVARVGANGDAVAGSYPVETTVVYENRNGVVERADPQTVGVTVGAERRFALRNVETERLRVGEGEARITADLVNMGEGTARQVAVRLQGGPDSPVTPTNGEAAVGDLGSDESAPVQFTVSVAEDAEPGTNSFAFAVEYENAAGDVLRAEPVRRALTIDNQRDPFQVTNVSADVSPGGSGTLDVTFRYVGDEPASAVNARFFATDPLSSADDGAFLGQVAPGDEVTATFSVSAGGTALVKTYDSSVEVRYDEPDGDTRFTDGLPVGVPVTASGGGPPFLPIGVGAALLLGGGAYVLMRRR